MNTNSKKTTEPISDEIRGLLKSGSAFKFAGEPICKAYEADGDYFVEAIGSSDQEDLVGDVMTQNALQIMEQQFVGKTVFMNHRTNVPDDVFGSITETKLIKKDGKQLLWFKIVVEQENESAMKSYRVIAGGRVQLGTSVTVLVKSKKPNPQRSGGIIIDEVEALELSIVGISCNRESQNLWASASKALALAMKKVSAEEPLNQGEQEMKTENIDAVETVTEKTVEAEINEQLNSLTASDIVVTAVTPKHFPRTLAKMAKVKAWKEAVAKGEKSEVEGIPVIKGMFNDILNQEPRFWELCDILCDVKWSLSWQIDNLQFLGQTDFSAIETTWAEALDEFKTAQVKSFAYWNEIIGDPADDSEDDDILEMSLDIEKSLNSLVEAKKIASNEDVQKQLHETGERIVAIAQKNGLIKESVPTELIPTDEQVQKSAVYQDLESKSKQEIAELQKKFDEANQNYEIAKAGMTAANEALEHFLRQPLVTAQGSSATS